ncbi:MAG TPA: sigma 54-interacting transcriptional regulator [Candidatus Acidoferrum sp.]|jgi:formate hydrogenlyase transcriptional activator
MQTESLLSILKLISDGSPLPEVLSVIARLIESQSVGLQCTIWLPEEDGKHLYCAAAPSIPGFAERAGRTAVGPKGASCGTAIYRRQPIYVPDILKDPGWDEYRDRMSPFGTRSVWSRPLFSGLGKPLGTFAVLSKEVRNPDRADLELIENASSITSIAIERHLNEEALRHEHEKEAKRRRYLEEEIRAEFGTIVGESRALKASLNLVAVVAPTDSSVLILGETGTGKELIARAIHNLSSRRERAFVKLNCAAIPLGLLESELFGHEKGAFTGAVAQKTGRFELADKGTLFLDEVGDIPLELQAKLLRVLQEQEFERLGSNHTHKVDVRLVAATHRDLPAMVKQGAFREDLYYRLKVFPVSVPSLRQRSDDIPKLVWHFTAVHAQKMNKRIDEIPPDVMEALIEYRWPGNVRELQNFIERAVILSPRCVLRAPIGELESFAPVKESSGPMGGLAEVERDHILRVLEASDWVVGGRNGAAERLGMKRTSLVYRMRKLRISRPQVLRSKAAASSYGND